MRNVSDKTFIDYQKKILTFNNFFRKSCRLRGNVEKKCGTAGQAIDEDIIQRMRIACWIPKATNSHSEYVITIAVAWQKLWQEGATMFLLYEHCLACSYFIITAKS